MYEIASGQLETAEMTLRESTFALNMPGSTWILLGRESTGICAKAIIRKPSRLPPRLVAHMRQYELNQLLPDALFVQGNAQLMLGKREEAKESFTQARTAAEALGSRRMLWQILAALAELEDDCRASECAPHSGTRDCHLHCRTHATRTARRFSQFAPGPRRHALTPLASELKRIQGLTAKAE